MNVLIEIISAREEIGQVKRHSDILQRVAAKARRGVLDAVEISAIIVLSMFVVFYLNRFFGGALNRFGIIPRTALGLIGIVLSPLLHYNEAHLTTNAISFFMLLVILFSH